MGTIYSYFLVGAQFLMIWLIISTASLKNLDLLSGPLTFSGIFLGLWSIYVMRKSVFRIIPDVSKYAKLVKDGPYSYVRHPMYSAVLLFSLGLLFTDIYYYRLVYFLVLFIILFLKIRYEEIQLRVHFKDYKKYESNTYKLIPFIY